MNKPLKEKQAPTLYRGEADHSSNRVASLVSQSLPAQSVRVVVPITDNLPILSSSCDSSQYPDNTGVGFRQLYPDEEMIGTFGDVFDRSLSFIVYRGQCSEKVLSFAAI